jgi:CBS-domain-containing membrane protein
MDCGSVMRPITVWLRETDPIGTAIDFMLGRHLALVPVVDDGNRFVGLLGGDRVMRAMLPKHLTMVRGLDRMGYLRESRQELRERLAGLRQRPIREVMDPRARVVHPDSALSDAQVVLAGSTQFVVPVTERSSGRLVGTISFFTLLRAVSEPGGE